MSASFVVDDAKILIRNKERCLHHVRAETSMDVDKVVATITPPSQLTWGAHAVLVGPPAVGCWPRIAYVTLIRHPFHLDEPIPAMAGADAPAAPAIGSLSDRLYELYEPLAQRVAAAVSSEIPPVVLSADCTTSLAVLTGLQRAGRNPSVVWLDAHGDLNTPGTSPSGYVGGMPLAVITGHSDPGGLAGRLGLRTVPERRVVLVDARDLDPGEEALLAGGQILRSSVDELIGAPPQGAPYLHVDLDVAGDLPGVRFKTAGGPLFDDVVAAVDRMLTVGGANPVAAFGVAATIDPAVEGCSETLVALRRTGWIDDPPLLVRRAQLYDADALSTLWLDCGLVFDAAAVSAELESCLNRDDGLVLVIASADRVVASIWGTYDGRRGWIQRLATAPDQRGRGFAARLVRLLERRLGQAGCRKVNLLIEPTNAEVAGFYATLGYSRDDLIFMERHLPS
jgi:arginase